jgi:hypothetical protein
MSRLRSVPEWVNPPLRAVTDIEELLLQVFGQSRAPHALGAWVCLSWLDAHDGEQTPGPLSRGLPTEVAAWAALSVMDAIAEGGPYPASSWWASRGIAPEDRISPQGWAERVGSGYTRHYSHGVAAAMNWLLGRITDPRPMAPMRDGSGEPIPIDQREQWRAELLRLSQPHPLAS